MRLFIKKIDFMYSHFSSRGAGFIFVLFSLLLVGCVHVQPIAERNSNANKPKQVIPNVNSQGITMHWQEKDIKSRVFKPLLDIKADNGMMKASSESGTLNQASGVLYKNGLPAARFQAPHVKASRASNIVIAYNGVVLNSISPPGVKVTADRFIWRMIENKIIVYGNVHVVYQPPKAKTPVAWGFAQRMTIDTQLQKLTIP